MNDLIVRLMKRERLGNLRQLNQPNSSLIDFASNDYLGLARSPMLHALVQSELIRCMDSPLYGSTGSRLLTGHSTKAQELEAFLASFHGYPSALLFNCGYMANVGLLSALATADDTILYDSHIHASMRDGIRLSRGKAYAFRHNDLTSLESRLKSRSSDGSCYVCICSVYSCDGTLAPLKEIGALCKKYTARLIVDEAHAVGVRGPEGKGLVAEEGLQSNIFAQVTTFGKALGTFGAIVLGSEKLRLVLLNFANACIYSTMLPLHCLIAVRCSYELMRSMDLERRRIDLLASIMHAHFGSGQGSIHAISAGSNEAADQVVREMHQRGFDVRALKSPTVRKGQEQIRICLHAFNTTEETTALCQNVLS